MSINAGVGVSKNISANRAGYEAAASAVSNIGDQKPDLCIVFASSEFDQDEVIAGVAKGANDAPIIGCSTAGEITGSGVFTRSVVVMVVKSDTIDFFTGLGENVSNGARQAGAFVAKETLDKAKNAGKELKVFIMLPDVLTGNGADAVRGALDVLGQHFPLVGGAAGDDFKFKQTYQYSDGRVVSGAIAAVGISGNFTMGVGVRHGWMPIGLPRKVTKSEGSVVHELDGKPAVSIYEDYFGQKVDELREEPLARLAITYPLGLKLPDYSNEYLLRDPITVNEDGSITCAAEIPMGSEVRIMIGSTEKAIEASEEAARNMMEPFKQNNSTPKFVLMFNCIAREKLFAQKAIDEINAMSQVIGREVPMIGFYTYGEQAPLGGEVHDLTKCNPKFHNETVVLFGVGE
jgi:hypothetical protein